MNVKVIPIDIYRRGVCFMCGAAEDLADCFVSYKLYGLADLVLNADWEHTRAITLCDDCDVWVCSVKPMALPDLCHELTHVVFKIFNIIGIDPTNDEEAYAYLYEYLFKEITSTSAEFPLQLSSDATSHIAPSQTDRLPHCD